MTNSLKEVKKIQQWMSEHVKIDLVCDYTLWEFLLDIVVFKTVG
jgi:hypothetical protein